MRFSSWSAWVWKTELRWHTDNLHIDLNNRLPNPFTVRRPVRPRNAETCILNEDDANVTRFD